MVPDLSSPEIVKRLEEIFGYTEEIYRGGYILPNGKLLDTLPTHTEHRCHHSVESICTREEFISAGAIRHVIGHNYFEMRNCPTDDQFSAMIEMIRTFGGDVALDLWKGNDMDSRRYGIGTHPIVVVKDVRGFYEPVKPPAPPEPSPSLPSPTA